MVTLFAVCTTAPVTSHDASACGYELYILLPLVGCGTCTYLALMGGRGDYVSRDVYERLQHLGMFSYRALAHPEVMPYED